MTVSAISLLAGRSVTHLHSSRSGTGVVATGDATLRLYPSGGAVSGGTRRAARAEQLTC